MFFDIPSLTYSTYQHLAVTLRLFVPVSFLPLYTRSSGYSSHIGAALISGVVQLPFCYLKHTYQFLGDNLDPLDSLFTTVLVNAASMLVLWPASTAVAPLVNS